MLESARRVFERTGYLNGRAAGVLAKARVSHETFCSYLDSRLDVFAAASVSLSTGLREEFRLARVEEAGAGHAATLKARVMADNPRAAEDYRQHGRFIAVFEQFATVGSAEADVRLMVRDSFVARSARVLERMQVDGVADARLDPWLATDVLNCMLERTVLNWYVLVLNAEHGDRIEDRIAALAWIWVRAFMIR